jgi:WD40 repeat protein
MASIFISYRRDDEDAFAGRLFDRLNLHFGDGQVFMDVDTIKPGADFVRVIDEEIGRCEVVLVVIGEKWLKGGNAEGATRLRPGDYVRREILAGLKAGKQLIPVLVGKAKMPGRGDLPKALHDFSQRNAVFISHARFRADVDLLIQSLEKAVRARTPGTQAPPAFVPFTTYKGHAGPVRCVAFSPDGGYIASGSGGDGRCDARYWKAATGEEVGREEYYKSAVHSVAFSPDGRWVAIGSDLIKYQSGNLSGLALWKLPDGGVRVAYPDAKGLTPVKAVAFSPDGRIVAAAAGNYLVQWSVEKLATLHRHGGSCAVRAVAFAPGGELLATGSHDHRVRIYHRDHVKSRIRMEGHSGIVTSVCFSPDGAAVASGSDDRTVRVWRASDGAPLRVLDCANPVRSVAFSPDAQTLAAGAASRVLLWRVADYHQSGVREGHRLAVNQVAFSPDSKTLASASDDATVKVWALG